VSIQRFGKVFIPTCDHCGVELPCEYDFDDAVNAKKIEWWKSVNEGGFWYDYCPECYEKMYGPAADFEGV